MQNGALYLGKLGLSYARHEHYDSIKVSWDL